jgi:hypothetical protein
MKVTGWKTPALAVLLVLPMVLLMDSSRSQAQPAPAPQTARQALMEMLFSKTPGTFVAHLPAATRAVLGKSDALSSLQQYSLLVSQLEAQGKGVQTFETGSVLLVTSDPRTGQKVEITVENDSLQGDQDDIEVGFQTYKAGQPQRTPFMPRMTFSMKMESGVWKLNEISFTIHVPLADPDFLKGVSDALKTRATGSSLQIVPPTQSTAQTLGSDASVVAAMRRILAAETAYAVSYRGVGYTCTLSNLDGFGGGEPDEHQAMLINSGLASGKKYGYVFTLSECAGTPATSLRITAAPNGNNFGRRAFCADQTGMIRYSADGTSATCIGSGTPLP